MEFQGAEEIPPENLDAPVTEIWCQDIKEIPSIQLPERALVAAKMSLFWRADRPDKPVYVEDKTNVALYVMAYKREKGKMTTVQLGADVEPWYHQMVKNFALPKDADLEAQPSADVETRTCCVHCTQKEKKGTRLVSDSWCDYVVVSDSLEGLAPVAVKQPKAEPRDTADIPLSNPDEPIDVESSPKPLVRTKAVKRKKPEGEAAAQPTKKISTKKIGMKGNLDAVVAKFSLGECFFRFPLLSDLVKFSLKKNLFYLFKQIHYLLSMMTVHRHPPTSIKENLEGTKTVEAEVEKTVEAEAEKTMKAEVEKTVEVEVETTDAGVTKPVSPEVVADV
ncbi:hypothetical protein HanHA300_Chr03g0091171 [Helianthus annuus]|nr:hypothetical protein HanHA300_Chr03g0091171 [Helianthus annuus]KAJ0767980.1 hypothetical protein HanLR1_Chr03g0096191 [Helianthus annuus]